MLQIQGPCRPTTRPVHRRNSYSTDQQADRSTHKVRRYIVHTIQRSTRIHRLSQNTVQTTAYSFFSTPYSRDCTITQAT